MNPWLTEVEQLADPDRNPCHDYLWHTGGGCMAYGANAWTVDGHVGYVLITGDDSGVPEPDAPTAWVGWYDDDGDRWAVCTDVPLGGSYDLLPILVRLALTNPESLTTYLEATR